MRTARVKNWALYQHYKDRSPPWIKLQKSLLDDFEFACLPLASKALAPMLWLLASESKDGEVRIDTDWLAFRLRTPIADIEAGLTPLIEKGFLIAASDALAPCLQDACLETETETEAEKEPNGSSSPAEKPGDRVPQCPHTEILALYHRALPMCPAMKVWNGTRAKHLAARWREDPKRQNLDYWERLFDYIAESEFLTGRAAGNRPFYASLDWIVKPENFAKIIEGRYNRRDAA